MEEKEEEKECVRQVERSLRKILKLTPVKLLKYVSDSCVRKFCHLRTETDPKNCVEGLVNPGPGLGGNDKS